MVVIEETTIFGCKWQIQPFLVVKSRVAIYNGR